MAKKNLDKKSDKSVFVEINFPGNTVRGEGETVLEAIESINPPVKIFTKGTIKVSSNGKEVLRTWMPGRMKRLFRPLSQSIVAKELTYLMK